MATDILSLVYSQIGFTFEVCARNALGRGEQRWVFLCCWVFLAYARQSK